MAPVLELVVDGAFAMDTVDTSTEVALAERGPARGTRRRSGCWSAGSAWG